MTNVRITRTSDVATGDEILGMWCDALIDCGALARAEASRSARGLRYPRYDQQGLEAFAAAFGRVRALQALHPLLEDPMLIPNPIEIKQGCREDAVEEYAEELRNRDGKLTEAA